MTPVSQPVYLFDITLDWQHYTADIEEQLAQNNVFVNKILDLWLQITQSRLHPCSLQLQKKLFLGGCMPSHLFALECSIRQQHNIFTKIKKSHQILCLKTIDSFFLIFCPPQNIHNSVYPLELFVAIKLQ